MMTNVTRKRMFFLEHTLNLNLAVSTAIHPRRNSNESRNVNQFVTGVCLALASSLFIGTSFILKKKGLLKLTGYNGAIRAGFYPIVEFSMENDRFWVFSIKARVVLDIYVKFNGGLVW